MLVSVSIFAGLQNETATSAGISVANQQRAHGRLFRRRQRPMICVPIITCKALTLHHPNFCQLATINPPLVGAHDFPAGLQKSGINFVFGSSDLVIWALIFQRSGRAILHLLPFLVF